MRFNSGETMLPTEEAIYWRLNEAEREAFLEEGTGSVALTPREVSRLEKELEQECQWMYEQERRRELVACLCD